MVNGAPQRRGGASVCARAERDDSACGRRRHFRARGAAAKQGLHHRRPQDTLTKSALARSKLRKR